MDCFPCSAAKRAVELRLTNEGVASAEIVARLSAIKCAMCAEADRQQAKRAKATS